MTPRKTSSAPETDAEEVSEAIRVLSGTVDNATQELNETNQRLLIIGDELSRIGDEIRWIVNNHSDVFARVIGKLPFDPGDHQWAAKINAMNPTERIFCTSCNTPSPRSLSDALRAGWTCLIDDEGNERGDFAGCCPACAEVCGTLEGEGTQRALTGKSLAEAAPAGSSSRSVATADQQVHPAANKLSESSMVACDVCSREVSPKVARREKWTDVARWQGGGHAAYLGICPGCHESEPESVAEKATVKCTSCERQVPAGEARQEKWKKIARWKAGGATAFQGLCPPCSRGEKPKTAKPKSLFE